MSLIPPPADLPLDARPAWYRLQHQLRAKGLWEGNVLHLRSAACACALYARAAQEFRAAGLSLATRDLHDARMNARTALANCLRIQSAIVPLSDEIDSEILAVCAPLPPDFLK